jgi:hypothetical protein
MGNIILPALSCRGVYALHNSQKQPSHISGIEFSWPTEFYSVGQLSVPRRDKVVIKVKCAVQCSTIILVQETEITYGNKKAAY